MEEIELYPSIKPLLSPGHYIGPFIEYPQN